jgi:NAD(P)-dependent dehydrogenase (short-subunit alcohol dehydrogenase family)
VSTSKVIIVTGASGGIGKACAEYLGAHGHLVYGTSRHAQDEIRQAGSFSMIRMDVTDATSVARGVSLVMEREGRLDAVVNNAGFHAVGPLECVPIEEIESSWRTNCLGAIRVCKEAIPIMRAHGGGHIISISSVGGVVGLPFQGAYCGSKFALEGMMEALRMEVRGFGIKVSLIEPGDIRHQNCHSEATVTKDYEESFHRAMKVAWTDEEKGYPPERIGPLVQGILDSPNPRERYSFGQAFQSAVPILKRLLPNRFVSWALGAYYRV